MNMIKKGLFALLLVSIPCSCMPVYGEEDESYEEDYDTDYDGSEESVNDEPSEEVHEEEHSGEEKKKPVDLLEDWEKELSDEQWEEDRWELPSYVSLDMPEIWQLPELPTGCEATAMTIAIDYMGFDLDKEDFAKKYMRYSVDDMAYGFMGDPFEEDGAGILPPALAESCNDYLESQHSDLQAFETTTYTFGELLSLTAKGYPVVIWVTTNYEPPEKGSTGSSRNGINYQWYANEHCVVIQGYNLDSGRIVLSDPGCGYIGQNLDEIRYLCESIGRYSVAISAAKG